MNLLGKKNKTYKDSDNKKITLAVITGCAGSGKTTLGSCLSRELGWVFIDKDTVTRDFTEYILNDSGHLPGDRESELYCDTIRPLEYKISFKSCFENLLLGNSVILTIPFITQIRDYAEWEKIVKMCDVNINLTSYNVKFIWVTHDEGAEFERIKQRGADRDKYKLDHWEEYCREMADIAPDPKYKAYLYKNDSLSIDEIHYEEVVQWLKK